MLKIYNMNPKVTTKKWNKEVQLIRQQRIYNGITENNPKERKKRRGTKNRCDKQKTNNKRPNLNPTMLIITINVSDLNNLMKR